MIEALFDPDAVRQILGNLLDNAERYTRGVEGRRVAIRLDSLNQSAQIVVTDNGSGILHSQRRRVFRAFVRNQPKDGPAGLGLGLALARSLARAQRGDLRLDPRRESGGASFVLTLPLR